MSKMPAKKKSCFQITSVTPAQVASSSIPDDAESLDDPDESRTEDVSSETFDVSRADFEPEVCDRSSSEETLNSVAETEAAVATAVHVPQELPAISGPLNGGIVFRRPVAGIVYFNQDAVGVCGSVGQTLCAPVGVIQQPTSVSAGVTNVSVGMSQAGHVAPGTSSAAITSSCSSRFRVIKLDHGSGEPFRRGRWTCTEFYEREPETMTRTVDNTRHVSMLDHGTDRDSGVGTTGGSVTAPATHSVQGPESNADGSLIVHLQSVELHQQSTSVHQNAVGAVMHSAFQPPGYCVIPGNKPAVISTPQQTSAPPQNLLPPCHNGIQQVQKSPSMPPTTQAQSFAYPAQSQAVHHLQTLVSASQADYQQQHLSVMQPATQVLPVTSVSVGPPVSQGPSPVLTPAAGSAQVLGLLVQSGESTLGSGGASLPGCQSAAIQGHLPQPGLGTCGSTVAPASQPQQSVSQCQSLGVAGNPPVSNTPHTVVSGLQNVPTVVPSASSTPMTMPNQTPPSAGQALQSQPQMAPGGTQNVPVSFAQASLSQVDGNRRKSDALPQAPLISGKDAMKPLIPESLQLATPSVNSLFGMSITIDGDEDRNPSTAFFRAFPPTKLRDSKTSCRSASGASIVAIDNKIEQAMDLVKSHLMYAVREEVEVLKEQIKELYERNSVLERENAVLKSLANNDQLSQLSVQLTNPCNSVSPQQVPVGAAPQEGTLPMVLPQQPNVSTA